MTPLTENRPVMRPAAGGFLRPLGQRELLALKALEEARLEDAARHIAALPSTPAGSRAWKLFLEGRLRMQIGDLLGAEPLFLQSAAVGLVWAFAADDERATAFRLAAMALEQAGAVQRRGERASEAIATHSAAHQLRMEHGTVEEQWESALSEGVALALARDYPAAIKCHSRALDCASRAEHASEDKLARTQSSLARTLREAGRMEESAIAAREAVGHCDNHDSAAAAVAEAEFALGDILVACAEAQIESPDTARSLLAEAVEHLRSAAESLAAFAGPHLRTAKLARDRLEFAERLLASL